VVGMDWELDNPEETGGTILWAQLLHSLL
jgi:hypothetical protein